MGEISQVNVFGNVQFSAAALQGLCWAENRSRTSPMGDGSMD